MTAQDRLKDILAKQTTCPICGGTGKDPYPGPDPRNPARCRRCAGKSVITRLKTLRDASNNLVDHAILKEHIGPHGELLTHFKQVDLIVSDFQADLEASGPGVGNTQRLQKMRASAADPGMREAFSLWLQENRGKP